MIHVQQIAKSFEDGPTPVRALQLITFQIATGEFVCLLGPSGSGKSTLLRIIGGLTQADSGQVLFQEQPLAEPHRDIGFVFQTTNLMPWRTVLDNILLPMEVRAGKVEADHRTQALDLLTLVGLEGFGDAYPKQLSGGMNQRVVLARSLILQPKLLLMDEPFGALDALTRERLNCELLRIHRLQTQTVLMVTHSIQEAVFLADRVLVMSDRPGQIAGQVQIDLPRPRSISMMGEERFGRLAMEVRRHIGELHPELSPAELAAN